MAAPLKVFISYSHNPNDRPLLDQFVLQLAPLVQAGKITYWEDSLMLPSQIWEEAIRDNLTQADIVVLLVSSDYTASEFVNRIEVPLAMQRQAAGQCQIVPVLLRSCLFGLMPYAKYEFLPKKPEHQRLLPVENWESKDNAFEVVVRQLHELVNQIAGTSEVKPNEARQFETQRADQDKIMAASFQLGTDSGKERLREKVQSLKISGPMGRLHLVNCNRQNVRDQFEEGFDRRRQTGAINHFYFLSACPKQLPPSLGERMVYELLGDLLENSAKAVHYRTDPVNHNRIKLEKLPIGYSLEKSQELFREFCAGWFGWADKQEFTEAIAANRLPLAKHQYTILPFYLRKKEWKPFFAEYFDWLSQQLADRPAGGPTLLLFFVFYHDNLHREQDEKSTEILNILDDICKKHPSAGHFYPLDPVHESDLRDWFDDLGEHNTARLQPVLDTLIESLPPEELQQFQQSKQLNMDRVELVQELVFDLYNK
jgi:hypothetical protein